MRNQSKHREAVAKQSDRNSREGRTLDEETNTGEGIAYGEEGAERVKLATIAWWHALTFWQD